MSSVEAKYHSIHHGITKLARLNILLSDLSFGPKKSMILLCDNTIAIKTANNLVQYDWTKHTVLDKNYIKENEDVGVILIPYNKNTNQLVDIMT